MFPAAFQEVVHVDAETSERHIADVKTANGLVIELQNSAMPLEELRSREAFYKRMIWIVNAVPFRETFHILEKLPDPKSEVAQDVVFCEQRHNRRGRLFWRKSENPDGDRSLVLVHSTTEIAAEIERSHCGHHLFDWVRPRTVWFDATAPVFLDLGGPDLFRLRRYDERGLRCIQRTAKARLVGKNGGTFLPFAVVAGEPG